MKKTLIIVIVSLFIILVSSLFLSLRPGSSPTNNTNGIPVPTSNKVIIPTRGQVITGTQDQGQADKNFNEELIRQRSPYPWYSKLPLYTTTYFVYFDLEEQVFIGKIYSKKNNLNNEKTEEVKRVILSSLAEMGIDTNSFRISWIIM